MSTIPQPSSYSPDIGPRDFWLRQQIDNKAIANLRAISLEGHIMKDVSSSYKVVGVSVSVCAEGRYFKGD